VGDRQRGVLGCACIAGGADDRAVAFYDVYVSINGGVWNLWKDNTGERGAIYPGTVGESYSFYTIAIDFAGNNESKAPTAEATTTVVDGNLAPVIVPIPNQTITEGSTFRLQAFASDPDGTGPTCASRSPPPPADSSSTG
jgi:hypothetical protein